MFGCRDEKAIAAILGGVSLLGNVGSASLVQLSVPSSWHPSDYLLVFMSFLVKLRQRNTSAILIVFVVVDALLQHRSIVQNRHARLNTCFSKATSGVLAGRLRTLVRRL